MSHKKKIVVIGGGHGTSVVLSGLKDENLGLAAIISMADNGGSTGRLRRDFGVSAVGDIRNCLAALSDAPELRDLFSYRFKSGELEGHSLGNLFLAAGELSNGSLQQSIDLARQALGVKAEIFPVTLDDTQLKYIGSDKEVVGMYEIAAVTLEPKPHLVLEPEAQLAETAKKAIAEADLIVIAPGNFYCSIIQALIVSGMPKALEDTSANVVMVANLVNANRHTDGFTPVNYLTEIDRLLGREVIDYVIYNTQAIDKENLKPDESQVIPSITQAKVGTTEFIPAELVDKQIVKPDPGDKIAFIRSSVRHDKKKLAEIILAL